MRAEEIVAHIEADLEGGLHPGHDALTVVNQACRMMEAARDWRYMRRERRDLRFRAPVSGSTSSFVGATGTLSKTGAFASYTLVPGDYVALTLNGTEYGNFRVLTRVDDDSITVADSTTSATFAGTATFDLNTSRLSLPSDVGRVVKVSGNLTSCAVPIDIQLISELEAESVATSNTTVYAAIAWENTVAASVPTATLRIWPEEQAAQVNALAIVYYRAWTTVTDPDAILPFPAYMDPLALQYAKALARAWDESGDEGMNLAAVQAGSVFRLAAREDSRNLPQTSGIRKGAVRPSMKQPDGYRPAYTYFPTYRN